MPNNTSSSPQDRSQATAYLAVDISKDSLHILFHNKVLQQSNSPRAWARIRRLVTAQSEPMTVVCEASGGYERGLTRALREHDVPIAVLNPAQVRHFARSEGQRAKTDELDVHVMQRFAQVHRPRIEPRWDKRREDFRVLLDRREQLTEFMAREKARLALMDALAHESILGLLKALREELKKIEQALRKAVGSDPLMTRQMVVMQEVVGVGEVTSWTLLGYLGELPQLSRGAAVALAGLAPYNRDSGTWRGKRFIQGGRAKVRRCLYLAAQSAAVHNPHIREYVAGLKGRGKTHRMAMVAAMRKLLLHLRSLLKSIENEDIQQLA